MQAENLEKPTMDEASGVRRIPDQEAPLPRSFGRLTLLKQLARGGMGDVFLASSGAIDGAEKACVVKTIRSDHAEDASFQARFLDEARIQAQLQHPGVAQILEAATDENDRPYVVVEFVEGRSLGELRQRLSEMGVRLHWQDAVKLSIGIGEALTYVHECKDASGVCLEIVHRDLSPQNVMVSYGGEVKLIDFGTAKGENRRSRTIAGVVFAKPGYVAPEVGNNTPGGVPADLYAWGVILWELLAGRRFLYGDPAQHLSAVASGKRHPARLARMIGCPEGLDEIIERLTATRVEDRYASARAAVLDLRELLSQAGEARAAGSERDALRTLMSELFPNEPVRSRSEFLELVALAKALRAPTDGPPSSRQKQKGDASLLLGTRYRLVKELGRGSSGIVYEAHHVDLDRAFALKLLNPEAFADPEAKERLRNEAKLLFGIEHPHFVSVHDFGFAEGERPFLVMELLSGETLAERLEKQRGMDFREVCQIGTQVLSALEAAHERGLIHRDIKLENLFLTSEGVLKLLDFGTAVARTEAVDEEDAPLRVFGSPETLAPEQARGEPGDARSDLYSVGACLYQLATGKPTHSGENLAQILRAKCCQDPMPIRQSAPARGLPRALETVLSRALERHPELRYRTATDFKNALRSVLESSRRRAMKQRAAIALVALGVVALGGLLMGERGLPTKAEEVSARASHWVKVGQSILGQPLAFLSWRTLNASTEVSPIRREPVAYKVTKDLLENLPFIAPWRLSEPLPLRAGAPTPDASAPTTTTPVGGETVGSSTGSAMAPGSNLSVEARPDDLSRALESIDRQTQGGQVVAALASARALGYKHPTEPRVLEAWSVAAANAKAWGEALRVADVWARSNPSERAERQLIWMLRRVGRVGESERRLRALTHKQEASRNAESPVAQLSRPN